MRTYDNQKLERIIKRYKLLRQKYPDTHIDHCVEQKTLADAIKVAACAINKNNKIHSHQCIIGRQNLNRFSKKLVLLEREFKGAENFDEIFRIVQRAKINDVGELTIYDTAMRIGCHLGKFPEKVYLHSGTRIGAKKLLGSLRGKTYLERGELPSPFRDENLSASEIEDILCIYKGEIKACVLAE